MCGRYSLHLIVEYLEGDGMEVDEFPDESQRRSYNFAPGYNGVVYRVERRGFGGRGGDEVEGEREEGKEGEEGEEEEGEKGEEGKEGKERNAEADRDAERRLEHRPERPEHLPEHRPGDAHQTVAEHETGDDRGKLRKRETEGDGGTAKTLYKLQSMKWGLVPFWTKRNPDYPSLLKTINCRDDSLLEDRGMWTSMKRKKRCIVIAEGFYEWLKKNNGKDRIPHYIKRKDGKLLCLAGLWDCVNYEGSDEPLYSYTIITTSANKQIEFLHDRMPVIFDNGCDDIRTWLDPDLTWCPELQSLLKPYKGELEIYPVTKDMNKVGESSPRFIIPIDSAENKQNIANFFGKGSPAKKRGLESLSSEPCGLEQLPEQLEKLSNPDQTLERLPGSERKLKDTESPSKAAKVKRSATSNQHPPRKPAAGNQRITKFFGK